MSTDGGKPPPPMPGGFVPEDFCDEVYDYIDDSLAEAMDAMEQELVKSVPASRADRGGVEAAIKTSCDHVQKVLQKEFDRNIDIFDRYVKKNVAAVAAGTISAGPNSAGTAAAGEAAAAGGSVNNGAAAPAAGGWGARAGSELAGAAAPVLAAGAGTGGGGDGGYSAASSAKGGAARGADGADAWALDVEESAPPKRLEEEEALDAEIQQLRKRRREALRRCAAMVRKGAREQAVLQDVNDYVEALQVGVSSSFDDNGLTPVPSKVQEAVQSCAELRVTAHRAQELTRRLEREQAIESAEGWAVAPGGGGSSAGGALGATVPPPRDLQAMLQQSSEQVVAGGIAEYSALGARLQG